MSGHVRHQEHSTPVHDPRGFLLEGGCVGHQREWSEVIAVQVNADDDLIQVERWVLEDGGGGFVWLDGRLALDLHVKVDWHGCAVERCDGARDGVETEGRSAGGR